MILSYVNIYIYIYFLIYIYYANAYAYAHVYAHVYAHIYAHAPHAPLHTHIHISHTTLKPFSRCTPDVVDIGNDSFDVWALGLLLFKYMLKLLVWMDLFPRTGVSVLAGTLTKQSAEYA